MVRPILEYSSTMWFHLQRKISRLNQFRDGQQDLTSYYQQISSVTSKTWLALSGAVQKDSKTDHVIQDTA